MGQYLLIGQRFRYNIGIRKSFQKLYIDIKAR
jgi:hypothetical protein